MPPPAPPMLEETFWMTKTMPSAPGVVLPSKTAPPEPVMRNVKCELNDEASLCNVLNALPPRLACAGVSHSTRPSGWVATRAEPFSVRDDGLANPFEKSSAGALAFQVNDCV